MLTVSLRSIITAALERRFPPSQGYGTIFPKGKHSGKADTGMIKAFAKSYAEAVLFAPAVTMIPWQALPEAFIKDRSAVSPAFLVISTLH